ncbi:MAG: 2-amino-4-hydroxy-6-hydroxymethyldihydropteridine diphosphokinase [Chloroflexi bacterium]|nr:2-amino-4-hydroxy-6-hydroxymethyldihydropteridine diphosphokinase [Chloroflexota bacterium]
MTRVFLGRVYLGLGANIGNRAANLRLALRWLEGPCRVTAVSSLYRSEAAVLEGQPPGPDYYNAACEAETDLSPAELLRFLKEIEHAIGRRPAARWAPRPIDIDILLYADQVVDTPALDIPHPRMVERNFVLVPLAELASDVEHPTLHRTIGDLAEEADFAGLQHLSGPGWATGGDEVEPDDALT